MQIKLTEPQERFVFSEAAFPAMIAGLGCVHPYTRVHTEHGLMRICDIDRPMRVLSWNEKDHKFQLSLSGGAFPKGRASLYRVTTPRGEFVSTGHHQIFSSDRKYEPVGSLCAGQSLSVACPDLLATTAELARLSSPLDDPHCSQTNASWMGHYADEARLYGQQLLEGASISLSSAPSQSGVRKSGRNSCPSACGHMDDQAQQKPKRIHRDQCGGRSYMTGCACRCVELEEVAEDRISSLQTERTSCAHQEFLRSPQMCEFHHKEELSSEYDGNQNPLQACSFSSSNMIDDTTILEVLEVERNHVYYDMQVLDTNNYVCEGGFIHHNSGKSHAAIIRAILKCLADPGISVGYYMPTYDLIKLRAMPGIEETLAKLGIPYKTNRSEYIISFGGGSIILRSYDRPERIIAYEVAHSIADEIDTLPADKAAYVWRKISERNRQKSKEKNSIGCVTTPDQGLAGFVYKTWGQTDDPEYDLIQASTYSNVTLPESYINQIRQNYDPVLAELYLNGEFVSLNANKVYHQFERRKHHSDRVIRDGDMLHVGLDFNVGGTCAVAFVIEGNKPIAVDEFVSHDTQDFITKLSRYDGHDLTVYPDASGAASRTNASLSDIALIRQAGISVDAPKMNPAVRDRVNAVNGLLAHENMYVNTDKCPKFTNALEVQGYSSKGEPEKFDKHPAIDDWADAGGYMINRKFPIRKPVLSTGIGFASGSFRC